MAFMDLHTHIAWGVDDGLASREEAEEALKMAADDGIITMVATPHIIPGITDSEKLDLIRSRLSELKNLAANKDIEIVTGSEVMLNSRTMDAIYRGDFIPVGDTKYILVEFNVRNPWAYNRPYAFLLTTIKMAGYKPVIAHAERYFNEGIDWDQLDQWVTEGFVIQINATSLLGKDRIFSKKNAWKLLYSGYGHIVSTDMHAVNGYRIPVLSEAYTKVASALGKNHADILFYENARRILENREVIELDPVPKKRLLGLF